MINPFLDRHGGISSGKGRVIRTGKVQVHYLQDRVEKAFSLSQWQVKDQSEGERCLNRDIGIDCLPTTFSGLRSNPCVDGLLTKPVRDVAAIAQCLVIIGPILHAVSSFVFGVSGGPFMRLGHGDHRWLSGFVLDPVPPENS